MDNYNWPLGNKLLYTFIFLSGQTCLLFSWLYSITSVVERCKFYQRNWHADYLLILKTTSQSLSNDVYISPELKQPMHCGISDKQFPWEKDKDMLISLGENIFFQREIYLHNYVSIISNFNELGEDYQVLRTIKCI